MGLHWSQPRAWPTAPPLTSRSVMLLRLKMSSVPVSTPGLLRYAFWYGRFTVRRSGKPCLGISTTFRIVGGTALA